MTMLNFNSEATMPAASFDSANSDAMERSNTRKEQWIRYYCPAMVLIGSILYVIHSWMAVA